MPSRKRLSISQQFLLFLAPAVCAAFIVAAAGVAYVQYLDEHRGQDQARQDILETSVKSLVNPLWDCDPATTQNVLSVTAQWPTVVGATLDDVCNGATHLVGDIPDSALHNGVTFKEADIAYVDEYSNVHNVGRLTIYFRDVSVWGLAVKQLPGDIAVLFILLASTLAVAYLANRRIITEPLRRLKTVMDGYSDGKAVPLDAFLDRNDELGDLVQAYDALMREVSKRYIRQLNLADCARLLLEAPISEGDRIEEVLSILLQTLKLDRVYMFKNFVHDGELCMQQIHETCGPGIAPQMGNPDLQCLPYEPDFIRWRDNLVSKQPVHGNIKDFPPQEREMLEPQSIRSLAAVPIWTSQGWWGFCGMDDTHAERSWPVNDLMFLQTAADIIGAYVQRAEAEKQQRHEREQFFRILDCMPNMIYVADKDSYEILFANSAACTAMGQDIAGMQCYKALQGKDAPCDFCTNHIIFSQSEAYCWEFKNLRNQRHYYIIDQAIRWTDGRDVRFEMAMDVTELKQIEQALRESEEQFRLAFENANDGVCLVDLNGRMFQVNNRMVEMFGYSKQELEQMTVVDISHPDDKDVSPRFIEKSVTGKVKSAVFEKRYIHKDGHILWGQVSSSLIMDGDDNPLHFISHVQNVTQRVTAEKALRESEERYRLLAENAGDIIWTMDENHRFSFASPSFQRLLGYTKEEAQALMDDEKSQGYLPPDSKKVVRQAVRKRMDSFARGEPDLSTYRIELEHVTKDGRKVWLETATTPIVDENGDFEGVVGVSRDVTDRRRAESELHKFYRSVENSPAGILITGLDGVIEYVNPAFCANTGYAKTEIIGQTPRILKSDVHGDAFYAELWKTISERNTWRGEICNRRKNGELYWELALISPVFNEEGVHTHYLAVKEDITDRKDLERLKEDIDRIMRHDLKAPLNALLGLPQLLAMNDSLSEEQQEIVRLIEESGRNMLRMIELSLDMFKMETGSFKPCLSPVDVLAVLRRVADQNKKLFGAKSIRCVVRVDGEEPAASLQVMVPAEERLLYSILVNLTANAMEATPFDTEIRFEVRRNGETVLEVHNSGAVPKPIRKGFFDKYITYGKQRGTGLGTYSARLMAEAMGSSIRMRTSDADNATCVSLHFPSSEQLPESECGNEE